MKLALAASGLLLFGCVGPSVNQAPVGDCRPVAEVESIGTSNRLEITFKENLVGYMDGRRYCDRAYRSMRVAKPLIDGKTLHLAERGNISVYYIDDASIDGNEPGLNCEIDGVGYISDPSSIEKLGNRIRIRMREFPPK